MRPFALILGLAALAAGAARADPPANPAQAHYSKAYDACLASPGGESTLGMMQCAQAETARHDRRLNAAYAKAMTGLNARQKARLQTAERAWIAYRDADCASFYDEDWGTIAKINAAVCMLDETIRRADALEHYPPEN